MNRTLPAAADLCIIIGTSLSVYPFASLPSFVKEGVPRVLINLDRVGGIGSRPDDVLLLGECDAGVRRFAKAMGWQEELERLWEQTNPNKATREAESAPSRDRDERLHNEVDRLTEEVDQTLNIAGAGRQRVERQLAEKERKEKARQSAATPSRSEQDESRGGLGHVFPHLVRKPSL